MKFKMTVYDAAKDDNGDRPTIMVKELVATDFDDGKKVGLKALHDSYTGYTRSCNWLVQDKGKRPHLVVYVSRQPPTRARRPRGWRFRRPPA